MLQKLDEWLLSEQLGLWQDAMYELDEVADDSELNDGELQDILEDTIDEDVHELLKLDDTLLKLEEWKQLLHDMLISDEHKKELELLESVLCDEQLDEKLLLLVLDMLLVQLELRERLLKLQLSSLEDEQRQDEEGEAHDELVDSEQSDKDNDEQLEDLKLEELQQLKLLDTELTMDDKELLEEHGLMNEEDGEMQDELEELELSDWQLEDMLLDLLLEEKLKLLELLDMLLKLELNLLLELQEHLVDDNWEEHDELSEGELLDVQLDDLLEDLLE